MASSKIHPSKSRTVLQSVAQFDLTKTSISSSITSLAIAAISNAKLAVYAGTSSGDLLLITLDSPEDGDEKINVSNYVSIGASVVSSILVDAVVGSVLVVSGGNVSVVDLELGGNVRRLSGLRGVTAVARRFCRNIDENGFSFVFDEVESENWSGGKLMKRLGGGVRSNSVRIKEHAGSGSNSSSSSVVAVAMARKLVIIDLSSRGEDGQVVSTSCVVLKEMPCVEGVRAMAWVDDSIVLGTRDGYSLMSCVSGNVTLIFSLPDMVADPRVKLLSKEEKVLLAVDNAGIIVDSRGQPVGGSLVFRQAPDCVGELSGYVVVAGDGKVELYHKRTGLCVQTVSVGGTVGGKRCFLADEGGSSGKFVAVGVASKVYCYRMVPYEEQLKDLLRKKNFKEAISLVEELEAEGDMSSEMASFVRAQVGFLLLFDLHFKEAVDQFLLSDTMQPSEIFPFVIRDPNRWSLLVPRNRYWGLHPPPAHIEDVVEDGLLAIQRAVFLKRAGVDTNIDNQFLLNPPSRTVLLESALKNLVRYLQATRDKDLQQPVKEGVDTLLMYLYRSLNCREEMEKLACSLNSCVVEELETLLEESGHLRTLAFLYAKKGMSSNALAIWRVLARNYSSDFDQESVHRHNIDDTHLMQVFSKETAAAEASKILEESADQDLILQHLGWISEINEELAVQILTSEKRVYPLPPDNVIAAVDPRKVMILQRFLQWLIEEQDSSDTQYHTLYALSLARSTLDFLEKESSVEQVDARNLTNPNTHSVTRNSLPENQLRERLQIFLNSSDLYDAEEVLELIEGSDLWLEKAILYRKLGQQTLVLQILALKLEDSEAAEQYCAELGRPDAYMQLLDMYLDPQNGKEPMFKAAVRLLHNHGESLDPLQVLERLSPDMPLQLASETILRMVRARLHHNLQGKIVHSLSRAVNVDARLARLEERSRFVQINDESLCDSCHARLGTKLFAMYPDDTIACYKCFRRQGDSTSVKGRNFKNDTLIKPGWLVSR
ncbi:hypothetical protein vseg_000803 [Gypsophila vaccaria]